MQESENLAGKRGGGVTRLETEAEKQWRERARGLLEKVRQLRRDLYGDRRGHRRRLEALERRLRARAK